MLLKYFLVFIAASILCVSCNDDDKTDTPISTTMPLEKQLKGDVDKYPDSLLLIQKLIEYYSDNGNYDTALVITDKAISKNPDVVELWDIKATLHFQDGDTTAAIKAFETAVNIYPLPEYIISLGTLYAQTKNSKALQLADALLLANKSKAAKEAMFIKGLYYNYAGNKTKAINYFDSSIRQDYNYMFAYREKAIALYDMGKYEDALHVLIKAVTVQNNFDEGYYWMGRCYEKLNKPKEAMESYQTTLLYDKNFVEAKEALKRLGVK